MFINTNQSPVTEGIPVSGLNSQDFLFRKLVSDVFCVFSALV